MKLLLVRLSALGDVVHSLPALELLREALPGAELVWAVEALAAPLLEGHPALDRVVVLDRRGALRAPSRARALRGLGRRVWSLRGERFDAALDLQGLLRSALVARASGAARVLGPRWAREGARFLYTDGLSVPRPGEAHAVERACALVRTCLAALGQEVPLGALPLARLPQGLRSEPAAAPLLVLLPGAGKPANRPPPELLAQVAGRCAEGVSGLRVVALGGPADQRRAEAVARLAPVPLEVLCGQDLITTARTLSSASAVVGGDTGPLHLARALGRPVVGLYNAAEPLRTGPQGLPGPAPALVLAGEALCAPCRARQCRRADRVRICLEPFSAERVAEDVLSALAPALEAC